MKIIWVIVGLLVLLLSAIVVDCSCGTSRYLECVVQSHYKIAAWTEHSTSVDSDGNVHTTTTHHPQEFHVIVESHQDKAAIDIHTTPAMFGAKRDGDEVTVWVRQGRWTKSRYLPTIQ